MNKSTIEKLGISKDYRGYVNCVELEKLQKQRNEMLEALIDQVLCIEAENSSPLCGIYETIEKAVPHIKGGWTEIKELLNE